MPIAKEIKELDSNYATSYTASNGVFYIVDSTMKVVSGPHSCREGFAHDFKTSSHAVGFNCTALTDDGINFLNDFFEKIESRLQLNERTVIYKTNRAHNVIVYFAKFWKEDFGRQSLASLFLRCGGAYYKGDFNKALNDYPLTKGSKKAIDWFLNGNINFKKNFSGYGFVDEVGSRSESELSEYLIGGKVEKYEGDLSKIQWVNYYE